MGKSERLTAKTSEARMSGMVGGKRGEYEL
jgi:hypothetical protein